MTVDDVISKIPRGTLPLLPSQSSFQTVGAGGSCWPWRPSPAT
jgi:hypothetical protein